MTSSHSEGFKSKTTKITSGGKSFSLDWDGGGESAADSVGSSASSSSVGTGPKRVAARPASSESTGSSSAGGGGKTLRPGIRGGSAGDRLSKSGPISGPSRVSRPSSSVGSSRGNTSTSTNTNTNTNTNTSEQQRSERMASSVGPPARTKSQPNTSRPSSSNISNSNGNSNSSNNTTTSGDASAAVPTIAAPKTFSEDLVDVLRLSKSNSWADRLEGVNLLKAQIRGTSAPTDRDVQKVMSYYMKQFNEAHKKVFSGVIDTMCDFVVIFKEEISDAWFRGK